MMLTLWVSGEASRKRAPGQGSGRVLDKWAAGLAMERERGEMQK